ncbi:MAG: M1 family metallopeptidase, partial [Rhabdochlamydiaceae bacterium]
MFKIDHARLEIEPDFEARSISGKIMYAAKATANPISSIDLDVADLNIRSINVNGAEASFETWQSSVKVELGFELASDSTARLEIEYCATPKKGLYFRGPDNENPSRFVHLFTQGQAEDSKFWYPCFDSPNMRFSSEVVAKIPRDMIAVSNGKLLSVKEEEEKGAGKRMWHFSQEIPHSSYLLSLIVGEYEKISIEHGGISVEYYVPKYR